MSAATPAPNFGSGKTIEELHALLTQCSFSRAECEAFIHAFGPWEPAVAVVEDAVESGEAIDLATVTARAFASGWRSLFASLGANAETLLEVMYLMRGSLWSELYDVTAIDPDAFNALRAARVARATASGRVAELPAPYQKLLEYRFSQSPSNRAEPLIEKLIQRGLLFSAASVASNNGEAMRSASLFEQYLDSHPSGATTVALQTEIARLDSQLIPAMPWLWIASYGLRRFIVPLEMLASEAEVLLEIAGSERSALLKDALSFLLELTRHDLEPASSFDEHLEKIVERYGNMPEDLGFAFSAIFASFALKVDVAETSRWLAILAPRLATHPYFICIANCVSYSIAKLRGESAQYELAKRSRDAAAAIDSPVFIALISTENISTALLAGDDDFFEESIDRIFAMTASLPSLDVFRQFALAARGEQYENSIRIPRYRDWGSVLFALAQEEASRITALLRESAARKYEYSRMAAMTTHVALAFIEENNEHLDRALAALDEQTGPLASAIKASRAGTPPTPGSPLFGIYRRCEQFVKRDETQGLRLSLLSGTAEVGGETVTLTNNALRLITYLAFARNGRSTNDLCAALYPDADFEEARNAVKMIVRRVRMQLHDDHAVVALKGGYQLNPAANVDFWACEDTVRTLSAKPRLTEAERRSLFDIVVRLGGEMPAAMQYVTWVHDISSSLLGLRDRAASILEQSLDRDGAGHEAPRFAAELLTRDPEDPIGIALKERV